LITEGQVTDALERLEALLREILGGGFEDEVHAQTENEKWYRPSIPVGELFRLWVRSRILDGAEAGWVFHGLRMGDRRRLFQLLKIDSSIVQAASAAQHAELVLEAVGLPVKRSHGLRTFLQQWQEISDLVHAGDADRAATLGRQRAERFLRRMLYFYCAAGHSQIFAEMLHDPGTLRVPKAFQGAKPEDLSALLVSDDVADLGFLALLLRKFSSRIEEASVVGMSGSPLVVFSQRDYEGFSTLGTALQPYTHDKPSRHARRQDDFADAARAITALVAAMAARNVVPDGALVIETCVSLVGTVFKGVTDDGRQVHLVTQPAPALGQRVLFLSSAACNYATSIWAPNPWPG